MNGDDVIKVLETVMTAPGMGESVKIDFKISRKNVLLLSSVIESGTAANGTGNPLLSALSKEVKEELKNIGDDWLQKAGLKELSDHLKLLSTAK